MLSHGSNKTISVNFTYGSENEIYTESKYIRPLDPILFTPEGNQTHCVVISPIQVGHLVLGAISDDINM
jgi:hypothetical protein